MHAIDAASEIDVERHADGNAPENLAHNGSFRGADERDPTVAFVGKAVKYYDERWRWMDWSGNVRRWNWAAFLGGPIWFAYRRMKGLAGAYLAWIAVALFINNLGFPALPLLAAQGLIMTLAGIYGTFLYGRRFRAELRRAFRQCKDEDERATFLRSQGGMSYRAATAAIVGLPVVAAATFWAAEEVVAGVEEKEGEIHALPPVNAPANKAFPPAEG